MFGRGPEPGSKRASEGFYQTPSTTMQKLALMAYPLCRQYDPEAKAAIWRSHEVDLIGVCRRHQSSEFAFLCVSSTPACLPGLHHTLLPAQTRGTRLSNPLEHSYHTKRMELSTPASLRMAKKGKEKC